MTENRLVFLPVPENFRFPQRDTLFTINPDIPIPVLIPEYSEENDLENLSVEMILSGMLRVIEEGQAEQEWIDYYSDFVLFLRPDILTKLKEIKDNGLDDNSFTQAYQLIMEGKAEESLFPVRDFLERYPLVWNGWFLLGWALRLLDRWADGEAAFRKAIELGGANSDTRNELAICLMESGDYAGAKRELEAAFRLDPENVKIISNMGVLAMKNGEKDKAAAFFRTVLELDSGDPVARKYLDSF
ncbi:MAG: tetratricopeptide repeat protein [Treponema sp.]|jgi:tetratricopeptide (TPR) repeat protein|nr:tetratricopeptide repeat protein [Treponema sp.]